MLRLKAKKIDYADFLAKMLDLIYRLFVAQPFLNRAADNPAVWIRFQIEIVAQLTASQSQPQRSPDIFSSLPDKIFLLLASR